ncbi:MAG: uracil-DNA glycosylase family protein [Brevundimonas sp.]|uniref:uracil-DNA glycosylase n=1 Tax=Brevundimonas sp. TaxID=1871086 RepID=UPI00391B1D0A
MVMSNPGDAARAVESWLMFWHDAGADDAYADAPVDRRAPLAPVLPLPGQRGGIAAAPVASPERITSAPTLDAAVAEARRMAREAASLDELKEAIAAFDGCPLKGQGASQSVFARGNGAGRLLVIGEAPGADEDRTGEPFAGEAGKLLDRILAAASLEGEAFITNSVFWRPPGNRTPSPDEQAVCLPFLERTLELLKPQAVLLLGAAAARVVLASPAAITRVRGQWHDWRLGEGGVSVPAMPTFHPAFLLRQPQAKREVWADVLAVRARLDDAQTVA